MPPLHLHEGRHARRRRKRLTREERIQRSYIIIYLASVKGKGVTVKQLAARQHLTAQTMRKYVKTIQRRLRRKHIRIQFLDGRLFYVNLEVKEQELRRQVVPTPANVELHAYLNYSNNGRNDIDIDVVKVVENNQQAIMAAVEEIRDLVEHRFNSKKLANMLKYGRSPVTPQSRNQFLYRHGHGEWHEF